jgi:hypothetical protein
LWLLVLPAKSKQAERLIESKRNEMELEIRNDDRNKDEIERKFINGTPEVPR